MRAFKSACAWLLLGCVLAAVGSEATLAGRHGGRLVRPTKAKASDAFGSYIVTVNATDVTFYNFPASQDCSGSNYTFYSSPLNVCLIEYIEPLHSNFSWNAIANSTHMWYNNFLSLTCEGSSILSRMYDIGACYQCPNQICKDDDTPPPRTFGALADNTVWMENQWHTELGTVFATSMNSGAIYKGTYNATKDCVDAVSCGVVSQLWVWGFKSVSGITYDGASRTAYALATNNDARESNVLISFSPDVPRNYTVLVQPPMELGLFGNLTLNGLARHPGAKSVFYATSLGNFTPGNGAIFVFETKSRTVRTVMTNLTAADGAFVFGDMLYVSEVFSATVHVFDITNPLRPAQVKSYAAPGMTSLDDFFVHASDSGVVITGADWMAGRVASWHANGTTNYTQLHAAGLVHPTSVRPELDAFGVWTSAYVTVTQGGRFPVETTGANGGAFYRLRLKGLPPSAQATHPRNAAERLLR